MKHLSSRSLRLCLTMHLPFSSFYFIQFFSNPFSQARRDDFFFPFLARNHSSAYFSCIFLVNKVILSQRFSFFFLCCRRLIVAFGLSLDC